MNRNVPVPRPPNNQHSNARNYKKTLEDGHTYQNKSESLKKRIMNYTLIQVDGIPRELANHKTLSSDIYFSKYGQVYNLYVADKSNQNDRPLSSLQAYISYQDELSASLALLGIEELEFRGETLIGNYGTNRYCESFLDRVPCEKEKCFYLHYFDSKNDALKPIHSKEYHRDRAMKNIMENLQKVIDMEVEEKKKSEFKFRSISCIIQMLIDEGYLSMKEYESIKIKGKLKNSNRLTTTKNVITNNSPFCPPKDENSNYKHNQENSHSPKIEEIDKNKSEVKIANVMKPIQPQCTPMKSLEQIEKESLLFEEMIGKKLLKNLQKKQEYSRFDFARPELAEEEFKYPENERKKNNKVKEIMMNYLI